MNRCLWMLSLTVSVILPSKAAWAVKDMAKITLVQLTTRNQSADSLIERMPAYFR